MNNRILLVVTGASRGLGRAICQALAEKQEDNFRIVRCCLVARSRDGLAATRDLLLQSPWTNTGKSSSPERRWIVDTHVLDLGDLDALDMKWQEIMQNLTPTDFDKLILINNAGSIGEIAPMVTSQSSLKEWKQTIDLNITSCFWTTRVWGQWAISNKLPATLVNISSLMAVQPFPTMSLYSAGKAARDMYSACVSQELSTNSPMIRLLNYAPGPLETEMVEEIRAAPALDVSLQPNFAQRLLDPLDSARILIQLLKKDDFTSGAHIDYYDVANSSE